MAALFCLLVVSPYDRLTTLTNLNETTSDQAACFRLSILHSFALHLNIVLGASEHKQSVLKISQWPDELLIKTTSRVALKRIILFFTSVHIDILSWTVNDTEVTENTCVCTENKKRPMLFFMQHV